MVMLTKLCNASALTSPQLVLLLLLVVPCTKRLNYFALQHHLDGETAYLPAGSIVLLTNRCSASASTTPPPPLLLLRPPAVLLAASANAVELVSPWLVSRSL